MKFEKLKALVTAGRVYVTQFNSREQMIRVRVRSILKAEKRAGHPQEYHVFTSNSPGCVTEEELEIR